MSARRLGLQYILREWYFISLLSTSSPRPDHARQRAKRDVTGQLMTTSGFACAKTESEATCDGHQEAGMDMDEKENGVKGKKIDLPRRMVMHWCPDPAVSVRSLHWGHSTRGTRILTRRW